VASKKSRPNRKQAINTRDSGSVAMSIAKLPSVSETLPYADDNDQFPL
jgi:hypothetical protein